MEPAFDHRVGRILRAVVAEHACRQAAVGVDQRDQGAADRNGGDAFEEAEPPAIVRDDAPAVVDN